MKPIATILIGMAFAALGGCASGGRMMGKHDTVVVQLLAADQRPMSRAKYEVRGWIEQLLTMRRSVKLAEGFTNENGYFSVSVPVHVGYRIIIGRLDDDEDRWLGRADIERKDLPPSGPLTLTVRWQVGPFISPLLKKEPNSDGQAEHLRPHPHPGSNVRAAQ